MRLESKVDTQAIQMLRLLFKMASILFKITFKAIYLLIIKPIIIIYKIILTLFTWFFITLSLLIVYFIFGKNKCNYP